jgi:hypothetical protein
MSQIDPEDRDAFETAFGGPSRKKRLRLQPGDVGGMSSAGSELVLSKSVSVTNRAGDIIELRDEERTLVTQAIHRFDNECGVKRYSGPVRRQVFFLPPEVYTVDSQGKRTLKTSDQRYFGRDELQNLGPGVRPGEESKYAKTDGSLLSIFNNFTEYPPVMYSNGKIVFYPSTTPNVSVEGPVDQGGGNAYTEVRTEILHETDLVQEVHAEIDGVNINPQRVFIEHVMGTVIGNDPNSTVGIAQYGQALAPQIWSNGEAQTIGTFRMEPVRRDPQSGDLDIRQRAAAYLLRILGPETTADDDPFAVAVEKQGKLYVNIPRPTSENYGDGCKGISAEVNLKGALKLYAGAASPSNTSIFGKLAGGIKLEVGRNRDTNNAIDLVLDGPLYTKIIGTGDDNGSGMVLSTTGNMGLDSTGDFLLSTGGSVNLTSNGATTIQGDKLIVTGTSGCTMNTGGYQQTVTGLTTLTYALAKVETIAAGGEVKTVAAGALVTTVAAGAIQTTAGAGAINMTAGAAMASQAGAAMDMTAGAAVTVNAGAAISLTAAAAITATASTAFVVTAPASIVLTSANIQLGGPSGVLGVVRAVPALPPGVPTLDFITGLPLLGSATVRSN